MDSWPLICVRAYRLCGLESQGGIDAVCTCRSERMLDLRYTSTCALRRSATKTCAGNIMIVLTDIQAETLRGLICYKRFGPDGHL